MLVRMALDGDGTAESPFTVNLPTYQLVQIDYLGKVAIVSIPDTDFPPEVIAANLLPDPPKINAAKGAKLNAQLLAAWHKHLDTRYQEHAGKFRPEAI